MNTWIQILEAIGYFLSGALSMMFTIRIIRYIKQGRQATDIRNRIIE